MNLVELVNSVVNSLNTREMAIIILLIVFLIAIFFIKSTRKAALGVLRAFFSIKLIIPFIGMTLYISLVISLILYLLSCMGLFNINLIIVAIFWFVIGAFPLFLKANDIEKKYKHFFRKNAIESLKLPAIFGFLINFFTFNVVIELILISVIIFIVLAIAVSKTNEKYKPAEKLFSALLIIIFICLILNFIYNLFTNPNGFLNITTLITFILPAILTIFLLPYIYALALYIEYDTFYSRLKSVKGVFNDSNIRKFVFKKVFKKYNLNFFGLTAFLPEFKFYNIQKKEDIEKEILKAEKRVTNKNLTYSTDISRSTLSPFENKFISFNKQGNLKIQDNSTDINLEVIFYGDDELIGQIISATTTEIDIESMITLSNESTTIAGQNAAAYSYDGAVGADIFIDDNDKGEKMIINIDFDPAFSTEYNIIKNTLVIKQNPST